MRATQLIKTARLSSLTGVQMKQSTPCSTKRWERNFWERRAKSSKSVTSVSLQNIPKYADQYMPGWGVQSTCEDRNRLIKYESEVWKTLQHTALQHEALLCSCTLPLHLKS